MPLKYISDNLRTAFALTGILWISAYSAGTLPLLLWKAHVPGIRAGTIAADDWRLPAAGANACGQAG
jgi:hypothetical protein